jgi:hypothetical protein
MKMADELKQVAENIVYIAEMTEKYGLNETSEWFEGVTLERDMKEIKKHAMDLQKAANKDSSVMQGSRSIVRRNRSKIRKIL